MTINAFQRVELWFWNLTILLLSQSSLTRSCLRRLYQLLNGKQSFLWGMVLVSSGFLGLLSGGAFYLLALGAR